MIEDHGFDEQVLIAFAAGELSGEQATLVAAHLERSPGDARFVQRVRTLVERMRADDTRLPPAAVVRRAVAAYRGDEPVAPGGPDWLTRVARTVASLVFDSGLRPALAGFRGGPSDRRLAFEGEAGRIDLQITPPRADGPWSVRGAVLLEECEPREAVLVRRPGGSPVGTALVDDAGGFRLECDPGAYELVVSIDDARRALVIEELDVG